MRRNPLPFIAVLVIVGLAATYGFHLYQNYAKINSELHAKSAKTVRPFVDEESVSEIGYVYEMRKEMHVREGRLNLVWFVAVPSENTHWSCAYEAGYPDFKVGDGIRIIHKRSDIDPDDYTGYLIGLHDEENGKTTRAWVLDEDELELDYFENSDE